MEPRSSSGISIQVSHQDSPMPAKDGRFPAALGKTIFIRWSRSGPSVPHSASPGPLSSIRTNDGEMRSTRSTSTSSRIMGRLATYSLVAVTKVRVT